MATRTAFPRVFWTAISFELAERGAFYGLMSVFSIYLALDAAKGGLGFDKDKIGFLLGLFVPLVNLLPILGGALADRFGYRRTLLVAFSLLSAGYLLTSQARAYGVVLAALIVLAFGAGTFKPIISGTIARSTDSTNSGFGFGIFYWTINLGAFLTPLLIARLKDISWSYVFWFSAALTGAMLLPVAFVYRDPPRPKNTRSVKEVLGQMFMVLRDWRFILMIAIYSLFWILYFQMFHTVLWYLEAFVDRGPLDDLFDHMLRLVGIDAHFHFDVAYVTTINAGAIILFQMPVSRLVNRLRPLPTMLAGVATATLGFVVLGLSSGIWVFIAGVVLYSLGEMTAHPKYLSWVARIAPKDKVALYMGYSSLYAVFGSFVGNNLGGQLYRRLVDDRIAMGLEPRPLALWWTFAAIGATCFLGLLSFDRFIAPKEPQAI
jgi:proton-dependent oligopeptide transporter, POT family